MAITSLDGENLTINLETFEAPCGPLAMHSNWNWAPWCKI